MVRPENCLSLAGESPVRVIAEEPGSRLRYIREIGCAERSVKSPEEGEQLCGPQPEVNVAASSNYQPKGVPESRADHITAKATDSILVSERILALCGVQTVAREERDRRDRRDPPRWESTQSETYKGQTEVVSGREGVRGVHSTCEGGKHKPLEGRNPTSVKRCKEVSVRA
jgi:hypothetical protein